MDNTVLVIGGAGYIGSHLCKTLMQAGYTPITYDNLSTGRRELVQFGPFIHGDLLDIDLLEDTLNRFCPQAIFHLASYSNTRDSLSCEELYYENNYSATLGLLKLIRSSGIPLLFSSSAAVYDGTSSVPLTEHSPIRPMSPYAHTKFLSEQAIRRYISNGNFAILRYFNVAGADPEGLIGEMHEPETHVIPLLIRTILQEEGPFTIFSGSHPTSDGTAERDFIHVTDLALAHLHILHYLKQGGRSLTLNLGSGKGHTVLQLIESLEQKTGIRIPLCTTTKHLSEPGRLIADISLAQQLLPWTPLHSSLDTILETALRWHTSQSPLSLL